MCPPQALSSTEQCLPLTPAICPKGDHDNAQKPIFCGPYQLQPVQVLMAKVTGGRSVHKVQAQRARARAFLIHWEGQKGCLCERPMCSGGPCHTACVRGPRSVRVKCACFHGAALGLCHPECICSGSTPRPELKQGS